MHKQLHKAAAPILCGGFGLFWRLVPVRVCCSTFYLNRSTANTTLGRTHERPHVKIYTTRIHGASHRSAAQHMLCKQFVPFLPSHPACTGRCLFRQAAPPPSERWFAARTSGQPTHSSPQATRADAAAQVDSACEISALEQTRLNHWRGPPPARASARARA